MYVDVEIKVEIEIIFICKYKGKNIFQLSHN